MKIFVITQEDNFVIPQNVEKIINLKEFDVIGICSVNSKASLVNKKMYFFNGFGIFQAMKIGIIFIFYRVYSFFDLLSFTKILPTRRSLKSVAVKYKIPYFSLSDPNSFYFINEIQSLKTDLIVSFSAPVVFKEVLLKCTPKGCINLHCSYLPFYAGIMPSFWVLFNDEKSTGVTVHYMDSKIDNGLILGQKMIILEKPISMFNLIKLTKKIGGELVISVLYNITSDSLELTSNEFVKGSYFSWPTVDQLKKFRNRGGKLV
jgi:hypothetical protein